MDSFRNSYLQNLSGGGGNSGSPLDILRQFATGPTSALQRGATGINQFSNQMSPEMRALNTAFPALQNILSGTSQASGLNALQPVFQQNLTDASNRLTATAPGNRFSSGMLQAQGSLGQKSLNDFNLMAANMLQQGMQNQIGAAGALGSLGNQAGNSQLQALQMLLGPAFGSMFQGGYAPSGLQQGMGIGSQLGGLFALLSRGGTSGATGTAPGAGLDPSWWSQLGGGLSGGTITP